MVGVYVGGTKGTSGKAKAMRQINYDRSAEWHVLRFLGWHRSLFDRNVCEIIRAKSISWLDFGFGATLEDSDAAIVGPDFLPGTSVTRSTWRSIWPTTGPQVSWDAVAEVTTSRGQEWVLVDAKALISELQSSCQARNWRDGLNMITDALARTKNALGVSLDADWLRGHYQFASRLTVLNHLLSHGERVHLLLVFFCGDLSDAQRNCSQTAEEWAGALAARNKHLGLPPDHSMSSHMHTLFLDVCPRTTQRRSEFNSRPTNTPPRKVLQHLSPVGEKAFR